MERAAVCWTLVLCVGFVAWLVTDIKSSGVDYAVHDYLVDEKTGIQRKPNEVMQMTRILNDTEDYIKSTNAVERLHDLVLNLNMESPTLIDQAYTKQEDLQLSGWPVADQAQCGRHLGAISDELHRWGNSSFTLARGRRGFELTQLVGSIGRPDARVFSAGLVTWMGSYEQCRRLALTSLPGLTAPIKTRYCWSRLRPKWWPKNETVYPPTVIRVGVCLPETCDTSSQKHYAKEISWLTKFEWPEFYAQNFDFESMFCLPDERSPIRQVPRAGRLFLCALSGWLALVLTATIFYEINMHKQRRRLGQLHQTTGETMKKSLSLISFEDSSATMGQLCSALSIHCSIKRFKAHRFKFNYAQAKGNETQRPRVDLSCFDFFKISMAIMIVLGHGAYLGTLYSRSLANRLEMNTGIFGSLTLCIGRFVDTFFIFFGVLTTYTMMRKFSSRQLASPLIWLAVNLGIFQRISTVFMLTYCYARLISPYTAAGPWWDYGVKKYSIRGECLNEPWWKSIPYLGCVGSPAISPCVPPAWFIVSYSQISLLLPLITYIIIKLPNAFWRVALMLFLSSISMLQQIIRLAQQTTVDRKSFALYGGFIVNLLEKFESSGQMSTLGRVGCVSIGCLVGYLLRRYETGDISQWPRWLRWRLTVPLTALLSVVVLFLPVIGYFISVQTQRVVGIEEFIVANAVSSLCWPLLNAVLIICGTTLYNHIVWTRFFSHPFWHAFNRLGLCIYLIHWEILTFALTSYEQGPSNGYVLDAVKLWAFSSIFTVLFAFAIHILFETPLSELLTLIGRVAVPQTLGQSKPNNEIKTSNDTDRLKTVSTTA